MSSVNLPFPSLLPPLTPGPAHEGRTSSGLQWAPRQALHGPGQCPSELSLQVLIYTQTPIHPVLIWGKLRAEAEAEPAERSVGLEHKGPASRRPRFEMGNRPQCSVSGLFLWPDTDSHSHLPLLQASQPRVSTNCSQGFLFPWSSPVRSHFLAGLYPPKVSWPMEGETETSPCIFPLLTSRGPRNMSQLGCPGLPQ